MLYSHLEREHLDPPPPDGSLSSASSHSSETGHTISFAIHPSTPAANASTPSHGKDFGGLDFKLIVDSKAGPASTIHLVAPTLQEKTAWISDISQVGVPSNWNTYSHNTWEKYSVTKCTPIDFTSTNNYDRISIWKKRLHRNSIGKSLLSTDGSYITTSTTTTTKKEDASHRFQCVETFFILDQFVDNKRFFQKQNKKKTFFN